MLLRILFGTVIESRAYWNSLKLVPCVWLFFFRKEYANRVKISVFWG